MFDTIFNDDFKKLLQLLGKLKNLQQSGSGIADLQKTLDDELPKLLPKEQNDLEKSSERGTGKDEVKSTEIEDLLNRATDFMRAVALGTDPTVSIKSLLDNEYLKRKAPDFVRKMQEIIAKAKGFAKNINIDTSSRPKQEKTSTHPDQPYNEVDSIKGKGSVALREGLKRLLPPGTPIGDNDSNRTAEYVHLFSESFIARLRGEEPPVINRLRESSDEQLRDIFKEGFVRVRRVPHPVIRNSLAVLNCDILSASEIEGLDHLVELENLFIKNTLIENLAIPVSLKRLKCIVAKNNIISEINGLEELVNLHTLDVTRNRIKTLDSLHSGPKDSLNVLIINQNQLQTLEGIMQFPHLTRMSFLGNNITKIPSDIINLEELISLDLGWNRLTSISRELPNSMRRLILPGNAINSIDDAVLPANLEVLDLSGNGIKSISFSRIHPRLRELRLGRNQIRQIEGTDNCPNLEILDLNMNDLSGLPDLSRLHKLSNLDLSFNKIRNENWDKIKEKLKPCKLDYEGNEGYEQWSRGLIKILRAF